MEKSTILVCLMLIGLSLTLITSPVRAPQPTANIVITPPWPTAQNTPASMQINVVGPADPTYDPQILLAMTVACYNGLPNAPAVAVEITYTGGSVLFYKTDFTLLEGSPPPKYPSDSLSEKQYVRSQLADHLGEPGDSSAYCAMKPLTGFPPDGMLHTTPQTITVTLHSTNPRMLVYALGKASPTDEKFNRWVPPTNPGFVVPEPSAIVALTLSVVALFAFIAKRRNITIKH